MSEGERRPYREFGSWLRARRLARRWTQEDLASRLNYDVTYLRKIEWGARKATEGFRARLAQVFELPVESLPDPEGHPPAAASLPRPATSFVGREHEVNEVAGLLRKTARLVTLIGAPGIGKTRLAIEVAARLDDELEHGSRFVSLLGTRDRAGVADAICDALGLRAAGSPAPERLLSDHLRQHELLLVLDNFEHVVSAAPLVNVLLEEATGLRVLATSRQPLRLAAETQFPVPPLEVAGPGDSGVTLFAERARMVRPEFTLEVVDVEVVAGICARLDGVPLAIELAAAATRLMAPVELLRELDHVLDLPAKGPVDVPVHQQTLRATIDWSHQLLAEEERVLFARLGIFSGGFTLNAAAAVCGTGRVDRAAVMAGVAALVDKSLVETQPDAPGGSRARLLEAIHEYALERLKERGETSELARRHAVHYAELAEIAENEVTGKEQARWLDVLGDEHGNLSAALGWTLAHEPATALRLAGALWRFWLLRGHFGEGRQWLEQALAAASSDDPRRTRAAIGAGVLARSQGDYERASQWFADAVRLAHRFDQAEDLALALLNAGIVAENQGRYQEAAERFEESLALYQQAGSQRGVGHALNGLGTVAVDLGDAATAAASFERALAAFKSLEDQWSIALASTNLGWVAHTAGDTAAAKAWYGNSLAVHRALGNDRGIANGLCNIGRVAVLEDDAPAARAYLEEALLMFRRLGERRGVAECFEELGAIAAREGELSRSARLYAAATALRDAIGAPLWPAEREVHERALELVRAGLDASEFDEAWADGRGMSTDTAIFLALARPSSAHMD